MEQSAQSPRAMSEPPHYMRGIVQSKSCYFCVNGDFYQPAKKQVVNLRFYRDLTHYKDHLTTVFSPRYGRVRNIMTAHGKNRVRSLEDLRSESVYVCAGSEKYKPCSYESITGPNNRGGGRVSYNVSPGHNKRINVPARFLSQGTKALLIKCWVNGIPSLGLKPITVQPPSQGVKLTLKNVLDAVHSKMKDLFSESASSCRLYTFEGQPITDIDEVEHCGCYVAARRKEIFKQGNYQEKSQPTNFSSSPRGKDRLIPPIRSNKTSSQSSPEHSISSNNGFRREKAKRDEENGFHFRPVKHKRSSEKVRQANYDDDKGGVFKAKTQNQATTGAKEIKDSPNTKTDLPVDQRQAEEVKEEIEGKDKKDKKKKKG